MKNNLYLIIYICIIIPTLSFVHHNNNKYEEKEIFEISVESEIKLLLDNSCIPCHNSKSKDEKSKKKLNFDDLLNNKLSKTKSIAKLNSIKKSISKGKMPTKKFVKKYPNKALSTEQQEMIMNWAESQAKVLIGQ